MRTRLLAALLAVVLGLVGTVLLVTYVRSVETEIRAGEQRVGVLVVAEPIAAGTPAERLADLVRVDETLARLVVDGSVRDLDELRGLVAATDLVPGEQLLHGRFVDPRELEPEIVVTIPDGMHQVTVPLEPHRAIGGALLPGDHVGVFVSMSTADGDRTHLMLHKVLVTRFQVEQSTPDPNDPLDPTQPSSRMLVTLALSAPDAERLVFAAEHGSLWLSREPLDADEIGTEVRRRATLFDPAAGDVTDPDEPADVAEAGS